MSAFDVKWVPAVVAGVAVAAAVALAVLDHTRVAWAVGIVGVVVQSFLPAAAKFVPQNDRVTLPDLHELDTDPETKP